MRLRDAASAVESLLTRADVEAAAGMIAIGWGAAGLLALHLAAVDVRIRRVVMVDTIASVRSLVETERHDQLAGWLVPGIVRGADSPNGYDVDDLQGLIAPRTAELVRADAASGGGGWIAALFDSGVAV